MNQPRLHDDWLDPEAVEIVRLLQKRGFTTYFVGGCVRDLLLNIHPKDYDIVTNARPNEVRRIIPHCFVIGKRFRLVLAKRGEQQYEISTFRQETKPEEEDIEIDLSSDEGTDPGIVESRSQRSPSIEGDNTFGTPEEDARRRDFTINSLFYDPISRELIDYENGMADLRGGIVRIIGDPITRLNEDPIRILRGIRLAQMIRFAIEPTLRQAMQTQASELQKTALPRRREEFLKFLRLPDPSLPFVLAHDLEVLQHATPTLDRLLSSPERAESFLKHLRDLHLNDKATPVELFAGLVYSFVRAEIEPDPMVEIRSHQVLENDLLMNWMRGELGMFKSEQLIVAKALNLMSLLRRRKDFEKRGDGRRRAVVGNAAFPIALQMCKCDLTLSSSDLQFWTDTAEAMGGSGNLGGRGGYGGGGFGGGGTGRSGARRKRRRRPPRHGGGGASGRAPGDVPPAKE